MARLIAHSQINARGLYWRGPAAESRLTWGDIGAGAQDASGLPPLRARYFFDEPFPKFGRMDPLCKIAVAAAQLIKRAGGFEGLKLDEVAQVGGTTQGCLEVDGQFEATRRAGAPSPALFVYTLPSMLQGEIAIHFKLRGRCVLYSGSAMSAKTALAHAVRLVEKGRSPAALTIFADAAAQQSACTAWLVGSKGGFQELADNGLDFTAKG